MKKIIFSLFVLLCIAGCWNYKELNEYSIVTGISIDKIDSGYKVSVLISNVPKGNNGTDNGSSNSEIVVYEGDGESIYEALKNIGLISPKELYLNSFYILVISDEVAYDGIIPVLDFFSKYSSSRNNFNIIIAKDCKAKDTLKIMTSITNFPSQSIADNLKSTSKLQGTVKISNFDSLTASLIREGMDSSVSTIVIDGDKDKGFSKDNLESSEPYAYIKLDNMAIFKGDKLVDFASRSESIGINILNNEIEEMYFSIQYDDSLLVIDTNELKTNMDISIQNGVPNANITLNGSAKIVESNGSIDFENETTIKTIEYMANDMLKTFVQEAINLSKKDDSDVIGIGRRFYVKYPKFYHETDNILQICQFFIESNLNIDTKSSTNKSLEALYVR